MLGGVKVARRRQCCSGEANVARGKRKVEIFLPIDIEYFYRIFFYRDVEYFFVVFYGNRFIILL
ncbi:MAG: hypothetical protein KBC30_09165 [Planctomycetes bacterium]|nr:hypothetical protein [Planctomycetota bacterium]